MTMGLDDYTRNARLKPALLTALPGAITVASWPSGLALGWSALWAIPVACGATMFLAQVARDRGKKLEERLFAAHGRPSERQLSYAYASNEPLLIERHRKLRALLPNLRIPTREDEGDDPKGAREAYAACVGQLIARTRDDALLLKENINYGFRRNLLGLKPFGLAIALLSALALGFFIWTTVGTQAVLPPLLIGAEIINVAAVLAWLLVVKPTWLTIPSNAYADRLLESLDRLP